MMFIKLNRLLVTVTLAIMTAPLAVGADPLVENLVATQREDGSKLVDINFDISNGNGPMEVSVTVSPDDGATWNVFPAAEHMTGDFGLGVENGTDLHIVWDSFADVPEMYWPNTRVRITATETSVSDAHTIMLPGEVPLQLVLISAGSFAMGSSLAELSRQEDEDQFAAELSADFYIGKYEITQEQWLALMGSWPDTAPTAEHGLGDLVPAYGISWDDAQAFVTALNRYVSTSGQSAITVALPTEAQWEYSCRAGTTTRFSYGNGFGTDDACAVETSRIANMWYCGNASTGQPIGQKLANSWGVYDMHGNISEWCQDWYGAYPGSPPTQTDPMGPGNGTERVRRGGASTSNAGDCRSATRAKSDPALRDSKIGFRIVGERP